MKRTHEPTEHPWRYRVIVVLVCTCLAALFWQVINLSVLQRQFLQTQGDARSVRNMEIPAYRGMITDRHGQPLAVSSPVYSVWINPQKLDINPEEKQLLAEIMSLSTAEMKQRIAAAQERSFLYLQRGLTPSVAAQIDHLKLADVHLQQEFRRFYPEGEVTAHILGITNIDDQGQEGLELLFNPWLQGVPGKHQVIKDRLGQVITKIGVVREPSPGNDVALSIDRRIQYLAYKELLHAVEQHQADCGSVVVLNTKTGEVLAMVNQPIYNPNRRYRSPDHRYRNRAVTDAFEPGSVMKPFTVAAALDAGYVTPETSFETDPGWMRVDGDIIRDLRNFGPLNTQEVLQYSSNVGIAKMALALEADELFDYLRRMGFGDLTDSDFPGEASGSLTVPYSWSAFERATIGFGYGATVTTLQLAQGYALFANAGALKPVTLLHQEGPTINVPVIKSEVAQEMLTMLESVVTDGTASRASVSGYRVAGKTGTARIAVDGSYTDARHIATFAGIAPVSDPQLVVVVAIHGPKSGQYYGSQVAAPVFSRIMAGTLQMLNITPDAKEM